MGFKKQKLNKQGQNDIFKHNLQNYYSQLYDLYFKKCNTSEKDIINILSSIFSRTKLPTNTKQQRDLTLLDIDKILSFNNRSLVDNSQQIKMMRMVIGLKQQSSNRQDSTNLRQIHNLVRMARLHFMSVRRQREQDTEEQVNEEPSERLQQQQNQEE